MSVLCVQIERSRTTIHLVGYAQKLERVSLNAYINTDDIIAHTHSIVLRRQVETHGSMRG